jgi:hypothetical protein
LARSSISCWYTRYPAHPRIFVHSLFLKLSSVAQKTPGFKTPSIAYSVTFLLRAKKGKIEKTNCQGLTGRSISVLWANTSLGMLLRWWHSNKQQAGRGNIGKSTLQTLPVLDVTALTPKQLAEAVALFDSMSGLDLLPLHEIDKDRVRHDLDNKFARDVLGLPEPIVETGGSLGLLRMKLAREPSIRGQKA